MSLSRPILNALALPLKLGRRRTPQASPTEPRILVIRRHRMGDMIYTLPLLHALRRHFPKAHLAVACDPLGAPIASACEAVDEVIVLNSGRNRWLDVWTNARRLQEFDWVLCAKGGFDRRLAALTRLTNAAIRIGFAPRPGGGQSYFTNPVPMPPDPHAEHQIETLLRLMPPLGVTRPLFLPRTLDLKLPDSARNFADGVLSRPPFAGRRSLALVSISKNRPVRFNEENYVALIQKFLESTSWPVGITGVPGDQAMAESLAAKFPADRVAAVATPGVLELAALLGRATCFVTPEGGAAHLSSATRTPTAVLWSGHYGKWRPRGERHVLVEAVGKETSIPVDRVWEALRPFLPAAK